MSAGWDQMIVAPTLDNVSNGSAIQPKFAAPITIKRPLG